MCILTAPVETLRWSSSSYTDRQRPSVILFYKWTGREAMPRAGGRVPPLISSSVYMPCPEPRCIPPESLNQRFSNCGTCPLGGHRRIFRGQAAAQASAPHDRAQGAPPLPVSPIFVWVEVGGAQPKIVTWEGGGSAEKV